MNLTNPQVAYMHAAPFYVPRRAEAGQSHHGVCWAAHTMHNDVCIISRREISLKIPGPPEIGMTTLRAPEYRESEILNGTIILILKVSI